jgi:D-alanyl-D-alanine carboxypeptidase
MSRSRIAALVILLCAPSAFAPAQEAPFKLPATDVGKLVAAYYEACNSEDSAAILQFWDRYSPSPPPMPPDQRLKRMLSIRSMTGSLEPVRLIEADGPRMSVLVRSEHQGYLRFDFRTENTPKLTLRAVAIDQAEADEGLEQPRATLKDFASALDSLLKAETDADRFSGVVLVARSGSVIFQQPYGFRDREHHAYNNSDTKFNLGSINKAFTALAIRQLASQGKLSLDDTLKTFLPDYPNPEAAQKVTIQNLLEMSSGIGDFFGERYDATPKESLMTIRSYFPLFADKKLNFEPGTNRQYSNGGYIVLGAIIEAVTGTDYYTYVREHIFAPAGMSETDSYAKDSVVVNRAVGYTRRPGGGPLHSNYAPLPGRGSSAGGGYSTALDLLRYVQALSDAKICTSDDPARQGFGIAGGAPGLNAAFDWDPESGTVVIVMANLDPPAAERISRRIRAMLPRS